MELRHLRYFLAVAEELSFRRAAERLHLSQPPLSAQIKSLETELGVALFERSTRSVRLTAAGQTLFEHARSLLSAANLAEQHTRNSGKGVFGTLSIGILAATRTSKLARILRSYRQKYPGVQFNLHELTSMEQMQRLRADQLDVGFLRPPVNFPELESQFVEESPMILALPAGHRLVKTKKIEWKDFDNEPMVLIHPTLQHRYYDSFFACCEKAGARPIVGQYANDVQSKMWLISAGFGISPTTKTVAEVKRPGLTFRELPPGLPQVKTMLVWKRTNNSPALQNFLKCFAEPV